MTLSSAIRRTGTPMKVITAALALLLMSSPAFAEKLSLDAISGYLNSMRQAKGAFTQINDDGTISTGTFYMKRPGRARFEYNPPEQAMVIAGANAVGVFDLKMKSVEQYPLDRTPLKIILADRVDLERAHMVTEHSYDGTATTVTAQDPDHPEYGNIQLVFTANPVELRQWKINDDSGSSTTVVLGELDTRSNQPNALFNLPLEMDKYRN